MAVRDAPRYVADGLFSVTPGAFVDYLAQSSNAVWGLSTVDSRGERLPVDASDAVKEYLSVVERLATGQVEPALENFGFKGLHCSLDPADSVQLARALYRGRLESHGEDVHASCSAMEHVARTVGLDRLATDARAVATLLSSRVESAAAAIASLRRTGVVACSIAATHCEANGANWDNVLAAVRSVSDVRPTMAEMEAIVKRCESLLTLMEEAGAGCEELRHAAEIFASDSMAMSGKYHRPIARQLRGAATRIMLSHHSKELVRRTRALSAVSENFAEPAEAVALYMDAGYSIAELYRLLTFEALDEYEDDWTDAAALREEQAGAHIKYLASIVSDAMGAAAEVTTAVVDGLGLVVCSVKGVVATGCCPPFLLSRSDVTHAVTIAKEALGTLIALTSEGSSSEADSFARAWMGYNESVVRLNQHQSSMAACVHRDLELLAKNAAVGDLQLSAQAFGRRAQQVVAEYGRSAEPVQCAGSYWESGVHKVRYGRLRLMRSIPMTWYNPLYFGSQTFKVYHLGAAADDEALQKYRVHMRFLIASSHRARTGVWPAGIAAAIESLPQETREVVERSGRIPVAVAMGWDSVGDGAALFDRSALRVRDKTNVPRRCALMSSAADLRTLAADEKREILYFATRDPVATAENYFRDLQDGTLIHNPVLVVAKPEQKPGSRVVAMEDAERRKGNSVLQNNAMSLVNTLPGSLMNASARKLARVEAANTAMLSENEASNSRKICLMLGVDFTKFGHFIAHALQLVVAEELDKYFGTTLYVPHKMLNFKQRIIVSPAGMFFSFMNVEGSDGQGLRNGEWQLMLGAAATMVFQSVRDAVPEVVPDEAIRLSWFMDDHNFPFLIWLLEQFASHSQRDAYVARVAQRLRGVVELTYGSLGLKAEASKAVASVTGYTQTGDVYEATGVMRCPAKALQSCIQLPTHVAPSITDILGVPQSALSGALANGCQIVAGYATMAWGSAYLLNKFIRRANESRLMAVGFLAAAPRCLGGLGVPPIVTAVVDRGFCRQDDAIFALVSLANGDGAFRAHARDVLTRERAQTDYCSWCIDPLLAPVANAPTMQNALDEDIKRSSLAQSMYGLSELQAQRRKAALAAWETYEVVPATVPSSMWSNSPATVFEGEICAVATSVTAKALLGSATLRAYRSINWARGQSWVAYAMSVSTATTGVGSVATFRAQAVLDSLCHTGCVSRVSAPVRHPLLWLAQPSSANEVGISTVVKICERPASLGTRALTAPAGQNSTVNYGTNWVTPSMSAAAASADVSYAVTQVGGGRSMHDITRELWHGFDLSRLSSREVNPFVALSAVAFVPPTHCPALKRAASRRSVDFVAMDDVKSQLGAGWHINYYLFEAAVLLLKELSQPAMDYALATGACVWEDPKCEMREGAPTVAESPVPVGWDRVVSTCEQALSVVRVASEYTYVGEPIASDTTRRFFELVAVVDLHTEEPVASMSEGMSSGTTLAFSADLAATFAIIPVLQGAHIPQKLRVNFGVEVVSGVVYRRLVTQLDSATVARHLCNVVASKACAADLRGEQPADHWYSRALPTRAECREVTNALDACGALSSAVSFLQKLAMKSSHGVSSNAEATFHGLLVRCAKFSPQWWCSRLCENMHTVATVRFAALAPTNGSVISACWAAKYGVRYTDVSNQLRAVKEEVNWGAYVDGSEPMPEIVRSLYCLSLTYAALCYGFTVASRLPAECHPDTPLTVFRAVVRYVSRVAAKYDIPYEEGATVGSTIRAVRDKGHRVPADRVERSLSSIHERLQALFSDFGEREPEGLLTAVLDPYDASVVAETHLVVTDVAVPTVVAHLSRLATMQAPLDQAHRLEGARAPQTDRSRRKSGRRSAARAGATPVEPVAAHVAADAAGDRSAEAALLAAAAGTTRNPVDAAMLRLAEDAARRPAAAPPAPAAREAGDALEAVPLVEDAAVGPAVPVQAVQPRRGGMVIRRPMVRATLVYDSEDD